LHEEPAQGHRLNSARLHLGQIGPGDFEEPQVFPGRPADMGRSRKGRFRHRRQPRNCAPEAGTLSEGARRRRRPDGLSDRDVAASSGEEEHGTPGSRGSREERAAKLKKYKVRSTKYKVMSTATDRFAEVRRTSHVRCFKETEIRGTCSALSQ